uniref:Uncharacterized protein n=1 Tax=Magnetococcus massalia (strain MO-1) TaxID=451514 RepID=A0A1S7LP76_MAGMO|nr:protein of unknown function [Candidatus Magnetococcus massalia]
MCLSQACCKTYPALVLFCSHNKEHAIVMDAFSQTPLNKHHNISAIMQNRIYRVIYRSLVCHSKANCDGPIM